MTILAQWSDGALPTPTNGSLVVDSSFGMPAAPSLKIASGATVANSWIPTFTATPTTSVRMYLKTPTAWPSGAFSVAALRSDGATSIFVLNIAGAGAPGQIRMVKSDGSTVVASPTGTIQTATSYRFEILYSKTNTKAKLSVYEIGSSTPLWASEQVDAMFNSNIDRVAVGKTNNSPTIASDWWIDSILVTDLYESPGPVEVIQEPEPDPEVTIGYWNGTSLTEASLPEGLTISRWNGTSLEAI